jgi:hypothetical protein
MLAMLLQMMQQQNSDRQRESETRAREAQERAVQQQRMFEIMQQNSASVLQTVMGFTEKIAAMQANRADQPDAVQLLMQGMEISNTYAEHHAELAKVKASADDDEDRGGLGDILRPLAAGALAYAHQAGLIPGAPKAAEASAPDIPAMAAQ